VRSKRIMAEFKIPTYVFLLFYSITAGGITWFLLWFVYDVMEIRQFLNVVTFRNLAIALFLTVTIGAAIIYRARNG